MVKIQILGTGCPKCTELAKNAKQAASELGIDYELEKVTDINQIISYGIMMTPGLVINGDIKSVGKLLSASDIKALLGEP